MTKKEARKFSRELRRSLSPQDIERCNDLILLQFQTIPLPFLYCVHSYIPSEKLLEPDTSLILKFLAFRYPGIKIAAPKIDMQTLQMHHYEVAESDLLQQNVYGIDEPAGGVLILPDAFDLVIIPLLTFDMNGNRVGYGKGYYDRFLANCRNDVVKVGVSFFDPVSRIDDVDDFDVALNYCCTPHKVFHW